jgi:hypothetical protein
MEIYNFKEIEAVYRDLGIIRILHMMKASGKKRINEVPCRKCEEK